MDSYRSRGDTELGFAGSTQTLGLRSSASTVSFPKEGRKLRSVLISLCAVLALVSIALAVYLIVVTVKQDGVETDGKTCKDTKNEERSYCSLSTCLQVAGAVKESMNESVDPCENFFQYSCGGWIKNNPIPSSQNLISTFHKAANGNNKKLMLLLLEDDDLPSGHAVRKTKDYFKSCMAEDENEKTAIHELQRLITRYGSWPVGNATWNESTWSLTEVLMELQRDFLDMSPLFVPKIQANPFNSSRYILQVSHPTFKRQFTPLTILRQSSTPLFQISLFSRLSENSGTMLSCLSSQTSMGLGFIIAYQLHVYTL